MATPSLISFPDAFLWLEPRHGISISDVWSLNVHELVPFVDFVYRLGSAAV